MSPSPAGRPCRRDLPRVVAATVARTVTWTVVALALWAVLPAALGAAVTTVASESMAPALRRGDVVAALRSTPGHSPEDSVGHVLLVHDPDHDGRLRLHRVVEVDDDGRLHLKGDANRVPDTSTVTEDEVVGTGFVRVPWVGLPGRWLAEGAVPPLVATALVALALLALGRSDRDIALGLPCRACGAPRSTAVPAERPSSGRLLVGTTTVVLVASLAAAAAPAGAVFSATSDGAATLGSLASYPCYRHHDDGDAVLAWDFDEPRGTGVIDRSGHGREGTMTGNARRVDAPCSGDPALALTPSGDARASTTTPVRAPERYTVSAWFRTDRPEGRIIGHSSTLAPASPYKDRHVYVGGDGKPRFGVQGPGNGFRFTIIGPTRVDDGRWHHVVGTYVPGVMRFYVDGRLAGERLDSQAPFAYDGYWRVGRESLDTWPGEPNAYGFTGEVDTARVWYRALDQTAVEDLYAQGR